jgi:SSS family solute:Na+ symporter
MVFPLVYVLLTRLWSVSHVHGFVTPADFVRARFGSRTLATLVAVAAIVATMPYMALQLVGMEVVLKTLGVPTEWPLVGAFALLALATFRSGLRGPALIAIVKDLLLLWTVLVAILYVATIPGYWSGIFRHTQATFERTPSLNDGLLLTPSNQLGYLTLVLGSALALLLYLHIMTGVLAARNRATVKRNLAALPVYTMLLGVTGLLGYLAGLPRRATSPGYLAGLPQRAAYRGRSQHHRARALRDYLPRLVRRHRLRRHRHRRSGPSRDYVDSRGKPVHPQRLPGVHSPRCQRRSGNPGQPPRIARGETGRVGAILLLNPQFAVDLQLIGGVIILQILPAVAIGLYTRWLHRYALVLGLIAGLITGLLLLYQIPQPGPGGTVIRAHFGGSSWPLAKLGFDTTMSISAGLVALAVNLIVAVIAPPPSAAGFPTPLTAPRHITRTPPSNEWRASSTERSDGNGCCRSSCFETVRRWGEPGARTGRGRQRLLLCAGGVSW